MEPLCDNKIRHRLAVIVMALMIVVFLIIDALMPAILSEYEDAYILQAILFGIGIGQVNLIATWTALAPGNFVQRLSWSLLLIVWTWYSYVIGQRLIYNEDSFPDPTFDAGVLGCLLLISFVAAQVPLWIAGRLFRWRLVSWLGSPNRQVQFSLRNLIWAMLAIALTIAPGKIILPRGRWDLTDLLDSSSVAPWIVLGTVVLTNVLITVPGLWIAFARTWATVFAFVVWLIYCSIITGIEVATVFLMSPGIKEKMLVAYLFVWLVNFMQFAVVYGALVVFRAIGFQFIRLPRKTAVVA